MKHFQQEETATPAISQAGSGTSISAQYERLLGEKDAVITEQRARIIELTEMNALLKQQLPAGSLVAQGRWSQIAGSVSKATRTLFGDTRSFIMGALLTAAIQNYLSYLKANPSTAVGFTVVTLYGALVFGAIFLMLRGAVRKLIEAKKNGGSLAFHGRLFWYSVAAAFAGIMSSIPEPHHHNSSSLWLTCIGVAVGGFALWQVRACTRTSGDAFPNVRALLKYS